MSSPDDSRLEYRVFEFAWRVMNLVRRSVFVRLVKCSASWLLEYNPALGSRQTAQIPGQRSIGRCSAAVALAFNLPSLLSLALCDERRSRLASSDERSSGRIGLFCSRFRKNLWIIYLEPPQKTKRCVSRVTRRANALRGNKICGVLNRLTRRACTRSLDQR